MSENLDSRSNSNATSNEDQADLPVINKDELTVPVNQPEDSESDCESHSRSDVDVTISTLEIQADAFSRFIQRQRLETMFELRRLRLGDQSVNVQENRERIEAHLQSIGQPQRATPTRSTVASAHMADIDALATRRCVSAALSSAGFRQDLESAVRRSIEVRPTRTAQEPTQRFVPPPPPPLPVEVPTRLEPTRDLPVQPYNIERQENELQSWQAITQLQREMIVLEISDLVHRQLVSSALESDFREHLERNVLNRLERGAPPEDAREQTAVAPVAVASRIVPPRVFPARTVPSATSATVGELSSRLDGMQQMLQMMFSMQIDMQRMLRQEVASALSQNPSAVMHPSSEAMTAGRCTVCLNAMADTILYRCGHLCVCYTCGLNLQHANSANGVKCPICRAPVVDILRVYRSSRDAE